MPSLLICYLLMVVQLNIVIRASVPKERSDIGENCMGASHLHPDRSRTSAPAVLDNMKDVEEEQQLKVQNRIIVVFGGTGSQGAAAIDALLKYNEGVESLPDRFILKTMTRNSYSRSAQDLDKRGVLVVQGDMDNESDVRGILEGAWGLFLVTFSDFESYGSEIHSGIRIAMMAQESGIQHLVFSGGARTNFPVLDSKAEIEDYIRAQLKFPYVLFLHTGFFYENLIFKGGQKRLSCSQVPDKTMTSAVFHVGFSTPFPPSFEIAMHSVLDVGRAAALSFIDPKRFPSESQVRIVGGKYSGDEYAAAFLQAANVTTVPNATFSAQYTPFPLTLIKEIIPGEAGVAITQIYQWYLDGGLLEYDSERNVEEAKRLYPEARDISQWFLEEGVQLVYKTCLLPDDSN